MAAKAFEGGIPVVWIEPTEEEPPPRLMTGFDHRGPRTSEVDCTQGPLLDALLLVFGAPPPSAGSPAQLERFLSERWRPRCLLAVFDALKRIVAGRWPRFIITSRTMEERCQDWDKFLAQAPDTGDPSRPEGNLRDRLKSVLLERFAWADALAEH